MRASARLCTQGTHPVPAVSVAAIAMLQNALMKTSRRKFLAGIGATAPVAGMTLSAAADDISPAERDWFRELGLKTLH